MKTLKSIKFSMLLISCIFITIGIMLLLNNKESYELIMKILVYGLVISGVFSMIKYFFTNVRRRFKQDDFIIGALLISIAMLLYITKDGAAYLTEKILALAIIISGLHKIQDMFDSIALGKKTVGIYLFGFVICAGLGVLFLFDIIKSENLFYVLLGLGMCVSGISDLVSNFYLASTIGNLEENIKTSSINDENVNDSEE